MMHSKSEKRGRCSPHDEGSLTPCGGADRDITESEQAREELPETPERWYSVIQGSPIATFVLGKDHKVLCWNTALEKLTCTKAEEVIGTSEPWRAFYSEPRPCLADLLLDGAISAIPRWYGKRGIKSRLAEEAYEATGFFPALGESGRWLHVSSAVIRDSLGDVVGSIENLQDITEHKLGEEALREREEHYRLLFESAHDAIFIMENHSFIDCNSKTLEMFRCEKEELIGQTPWRFSPEYQPDGQESKKKALEKITRAVQGTPQVFEWKHCRYDGTLLDAEVSLNRFEHKGTFFLQAIVRDLTERKLAEEALQRSEKLYRGVIDNIQDTFYRTDVNGTILMVSASGAAMFGYEAANDMIGLSVTEHVYANPEDRKLFLTALEAQGYVKDYELKLKRRDGTVIDVATSSHQYFDDNGAVLGVEGILRDISRRKRAEEALRDSEERFSKAFHISPAPTIISTIDDGRYVDVNDSFLRMLGYAREELIGRTAMELNVWVDYHERDKVVEELKRQGFIRGELLHLRTKEGESRDALVSAEIVTLNEEKFILSIFYDITEQRKLENQLYEAQKMEAIGTLAGGIAHDFNNILSAILGYSDLALVSPNLDERLRRCLDQIRKAGVRARDLVKQILTFSRLTDEKPRPLRVSPIVKEVLKLLRATTPSTVEIEQDIQPEPDMVLADPTHIHQIMMNLCTNAVHAMRKRKGKLKVSLAPEEIKPRGVLNFRHGLTPGMYLKLTVGDTGHGISPAIMDRIFDPFFTTKRLGEGTGMGLSVVHGITKSYGGSITVESGIGNGAEFNVYLPLIVEKENEREVEVVDQMPGGKERILFVDDEDSIVGLGKEILADLGYDVVGTTSSLEALEFFRARPDRLDLVITDMTMPSMTGIELAQEIMRIRPGMPVILCTGFSEAITSEEAKALGLREFIMKPMNVHQFAQVIRRVLDQNPTINTPE
jgi:two-component system, cell cycle sensor histidine kinase and response regulator CckA